MFDWPTTRARGGLQAQAVIALAFFFLDLGRCALGLALGHLGLYPLAGGLVCLCQGLGLSLGFDGRVLGLQSLLLGFQLDHLVNN